MKRLLLAALLVGCGTRTEPTTDPAPDVVTLGCPATRPANGQRCSNPIGTNIEYTCYYFVPDTGDASSYELCAHGSRCVDGTFRDGGNECLFRRDHCTEGRRCLFFGYHAPDPTSACAVACERECRCDAATRTLSCTPQVCESAP